MIDSESIVVSSRVRIARNFAGMLFPSRLESKKGLELIPKIASAVSPLGKFRIYAMNKLGAEDAEVMWEKHLISREILTNKESGAAIVRNDELVSILVNEEDHMRVQCIMKGLTLDKAYSTINDIDDEIATVLDYAFSPKYGFLTSCVTNTGNGLRASVMLFLPALTLTEKISQVIESLKSKGLTVRGELGEGSNPSGYMYQISNAISFGITERETISNVVTAVKRIVELEKSERKIMKNSLKTRDICMRAWGILTNAVLLSFDEFMTLAGQVKLGVALDFLSLKDNNIFEKLAYLASDAGLTKTLGRSISGENALKQRAGYIQKTLKNLRLK